MPRMLLQCKQPRAIGLGLQCSVACQKNYQGPSVGEEDKSESMSCGDTGRIVQTASEKPADVRMAPEPAKMRVAQEPTIIRRTPGTVPTYASILKNGSKRRIAKVSQQEELTFKK